MVKYGDASREVWGRFPFYEVWGRFPFYEVWKYGDATLWKYGDATL